MTSKISVYCFNRLPPPLAPRPWVMRKNVPRVQKATCAALPLIVTFEKVTPALAAGGANPDVKATPLVEELRLPLKSYCATPPSKTLAKKHTAIKVNPADRFVAIFSGEQTA